VTWLRIGFPRKAKPSCLSKHLDRLSGPRICLCSKYQRSFLEVEKLDLKLATNPFLVSKFRMTGTTQPLCRTPGVVPVAKLSFYLPTG